MKRNNHQRIRLKTPSGEIIWVGIADICGGSWVKIGIEADPKIEILREELLPQQECYYPS